LIRENNLSFTASFWVIYVTLRDNCTFWKLVMNPFIKAHFKIAQFSRIVLLSYFILSIFLDMQVSNIIMCTYMWTPSFEVFGEARQGGRKQY